MCGTAGAPSRRSPRDMALDEQPLRWTQRARGRGRRPLSCHAQMRVTRERRRARHGALSEQVCRTRAAWCASEGAARERASKQCGSGGGSMARLGHIQKRSGRKRMLSGRLDLLSFLGPNENASKRQGYLPKLFTFTGYIWLSVADSITANTPTSQLSPVPFMRPMPSEAGGESTGRISGAGRIPSSGLFSNRTKAPIYLFVFTGVPQITPRQCYT